MCITLATVILQVLNIKMIGNPFSYHRNIFLEDILWQGFTPTLVHINWSHWLLNMINFYMIIIFFNGVWNGWILIQLFTLGSLFILLMLYLFNPSIEQYAGMSGVLYTLVVYGVIKIYNKQKFLSIIIGVLILIKLLMDAKINHFMGVDIFLISVNVIIDVHWYGTIFSLLFISIEYSIIEYKKR